MGGQGEKRESSGTTRGIFATRGRGIGPFKHAEFEGPSCATKHGNALERGFRGRFETTEYE